MTAPILVVEDDPALLDVVVTTLGFEGFATAAATDGAEALDQIARTRPSMILLDMRMPIMDGWALARELKERRLDVPIVVMTAAQDARRWAQEIGAQDYLEKPFDLTHLVGTVERVLRAAR